MHEIYFYKISFNLNFSFIYFFILILFIYQYKHIFFSYDLTIHDEVFTYYSVPLNILYGIFIIFNQIKKP